MQWIPVHFRDSFMSAPFFIIFDLSDHSSEDTV
jgi:hypothetical protein